MRHTRLLVAALLLVVLASPLMAQEWDLGISFTPVQSDDDYGSEEYDFFENSLTGFHLGYGWFHFLYATWDAIVVPPGMIRDWTSVSYFDEGTNTEVWIEGYYRPGFLNLMGVGANITLGPINAFGTIGVNNIYVHRQAELEGLDTSFGANIRVAAGYIADWWGVHLTGTVVFPTFKQAVNTITAMTSDDQAVSDAAKEVFKSNLVPSLMFSIYL